jgi:hypothetical protein
MCLWCLNHLFGRFLPPGTLAMWVQRPSCARPSPTAASCKVLPTFGRFTPYRAVMRSMYPGGGTLYTKKPTACRRWVVADIDIVILHFFQRLGPGVHRRWMQLSMHGRLEDSSWASPKHTSPLETLSRWQRMQSPSTMDMTTSHPRQSCSFNCHGPRCTMALRWLPGGRAN